MANQTEQGSPIRLAYIGCWHKNEMYCTNAATPWILSVAPEWRLT
jgi:hypothetical protein